MKINFNKKDENAEVIRLSGREAKLKSHVLPDINSNNNTKYINFSLYINLQRLAPEAKLASHLTDNQGPTRHPGSIPGWGASVLIFNVKNFRK